MMISDEDWFPMDGISFFVELVVVTDIAGSLVALPGGGEGEGQLPKNSHSVIPLLSFDGLLVTTIPILELEGGCVMVGGGTVTAGTTTGTGRGWGGVLITSVLGHNPMYRQNSIRSMVC